MRDDMEHLIVERPRMGGGKTQTRKHRRKAKQDPENAPCIRGMRKLHKMNWSDAKELNENLNPLFRWLNKQEGRPWNAVYADICEQVKPDSATQLHILQHVDDIVEKDVIIVNGKPCYKQRHYWQWNPDNDGFLPISDYPRGSYRQMYVDPRDGKLKFAPRREKFKRGKKTIKGIAHPKDEMVQFHQIEGIWYEVEFRKPQSWEVRRQDSKGRTLGYWGSYCTAFDCITKTHGRALREIESDYGQLIIPHKKRQLNSKEIKRLAA